MRLQILESCEPGQWQAPSEVPVEGTVAGWVFENQKPLVVHDMETEHRFPASQALRHQSVRALCVMPLTTAHGRLGVLSIWSDQPGIYDQQDLEFAQLVAAQIAVALGAQTYQHKLSLEREHSKLLLEVNNTLVSNLNLRELLTEISGCLRRVIPHDLAGLALYEPAEKQLRLAALDFPSNDNFLLEGEVIPLLQTSLERFSCLQHPNLFVQLMLRRRWAVLLIPELEPAQKLPRIAEAFREHSMATGRVHGCLLCSLTSVFASMDAEWSMPCCYAAW